MRKSAKIIGFMALGVVVTASLFVLMAGVPLSTKSMESVANSFQPEESWRLESEQITPGKILCLGGKCDNLQRRWVLPAKLKSQAEFESIAKLSGKSMAIEQECQLDGQSEEQISFCVAEMVRDGYRVRLYYDSLKDGTSEVQLNVRKHMEGGVL